MTQPEKDIPQNTLDSLPGGVTREVAVEDTTNALVRYGDAANKAVRVNVVAGGGGGGGSDPPETFNDSLVGAGAGPTHSLSTGVEARAFTFVLTPTGGATSWTFHFEFSSDGGTTWLSSQQYDQNLAPAATEIPLTPQSVAVDFRFVLDSVDAGGMDVSLMASPRAMSAAPGYAIDTDDNDPQRAKPLAGVASSYGNGELVTQLVALDSVINNYVRIQGDLPIVHINSTDAAVAQNTSSTGVLTVGTLPYLATRVALQVRETGGATAWDVRLKVTPSSASSLFFQILAHTNTDGDGTIKFLSDVLFNSFLIDVVGFTGPGNIFIYCAFN
jgi:hypothetical protein